MTIKLTEGEYVAATEDYLGYCTACGEERSECEPDARNYKCEGCGKPSVFGAEELMLMGDIELVD